MAAGGKESAPKVRFSIAALAVPKVDLSQNKKTKITEYFKKFDKNNDGVITKDELKGIFGDLSDKELETMVSVIDVNGDGVIDYSEFVDWVMGPPNVQYGWAGASHDDIKGVEENPEDAEMWNHLGVEGGGIVCGKKLTAADCFIKALELKADYAEAWFNLANEGGGVVCGVAMSEEDCYDKQMRLRTDEKVKAVRVLQNYFRKKFKQSGWTFSLVAHLIQKRLHSWTTTFEEVGQKKEFLDKASFTAGLNILLPKYTSAQAHVLWETFTSKTGLEGVDFKGFCGIVEAGHTGGQDIAEFADLCDEDFKALKSNS